MSKTFNLSGRPTVPGIEGPEALRECVDDLPFACERTHGTTVEAADDFVIIVEESRLLGAIRAAFEAGRNEGAA